MANRKISDLTALTAPATGDLLPIVDISEAAAADKNKKITIGELFASIPAGTAAAPSVALEGDNTGIYFPAPDTIATVVNGAEASRTDSSGRLLVGTSSWSVGATAAFVGNSSSGTGNADVYFSRGLAATGMSSGQDVSVISFSDNAGGKFAIIGTQVDGTPGASDYPGRLVFSTTADGAASPTEAMRIKSTQIINFSNAPTHADNTAATAAGLAVGDVYKTVLGVLMIRF
jgi:hypothetical protein